MKEGIKIILDYLRSGLLRDIRECRWRYGWLQVTLEGVERVEVEEKVVRALHWRK